MDRNYLYLSSNYLTLKIWWTMEMHDSLNAIFIERRMKLEGVKNWRAANTAPSLKPEYQG